MGARGPGVRRRYPQWSTQSIRDFAEEAQDGGVAEEEARRPLRAATGRCRVCRDRRVDALAGSLVRAEYSIPPWLPADGRHEPRWWVLPIRRATRRIETPEMRGWLAVNKGVDGSARRPELSWVVDEETGKLYWDLGVNKNPAKGVELVCTNPECTNKPRKKLRDLYALAQDAWEREGHRVSPRVGPSFWL